RLHPGHVVATIVHRIKLILFEADFIAFPFSDLSRFFSIGPVMLIAAVALLIARGRFADAYLVSGPMMYALLSLGLVYVETRYIRYAWISYLLAGAVVLQAGWELLGRLALRVHPLLPGMLAPLAVVVVAAGAVAELGTRLPALLDEARMALTDVRSVSPTQ